MNHTWRLLAIAGVAATAVYLLDLSPGVNSACALAVGAGTVWACFTGPRRLGAEPRSAWRLIGAGALSFLIGLLIRPVVTDAGLPLLADAFTVPGYVLLCLFLGKLLQARNSLQRHAVIDGLIVCLAGGLAAILLLAAPAAEITGRSPVVSALAGLYPLFDVVVLLLVVNLSFTAQVWPVSLWTLLSSMTLILTGDLAYAIIGVSGRLYSTPLMDAPFLIAFTLMGVTALHPSAVRLGRASRQPVQAWSWPRMLLLAPALVTPFALLVTIGDAPDRRLMIGMVGALIVALLLVRAVSAVQAQVAAQLQAEHQATHDPLTGLPNRRMIGVRIGRLIRRLPPGDPRSVWVFLLDLDGFKYVNDSWGHDTGDRVVIEVGTRLRAAVPDGVPIAALGGDEFLLAYVGSEDDAMRQLERVSRCFDDPFVVRDVELQITASVGIAQVGPGGDAEELMRDADTAMYQAKSEGPGHTRVSTNPCMTGYASASSWRWRCVRRSPTTSCGSRTSLWCCSVPGGRSAPRPWSAGRTRNAAPSRRPCSSRSPRMPA